MNETGNKKNKYSSKQKNRKKKGITQGKNIIRDY